MPTGAQLQASQSVAKPPAQQTDNAADDAPPSGPVWHRAATWPTDEQLDKFLADVQHTCAVADKDYANAARIGKGTATSLAHAEAYHAAVQDRMARRKKELAEKELRAMAIGSRRH
eukprot:CAMPEP_0174851006 /NCGR_PEP_ID=MMETSP1114-20130205/21257_1 /TAXON_ID=312471 /ORGANISM="Neobodo designis, Strain CCAP 1951/1" /LENGTH=115 /DNA_ID=CAMNT_0016085503 /DNA_START=43 /DNA_END=390 /DNA_ORIENTATION=-